MELVLAKDLSSHSYIISSKKSFLLRFCDTGFKNKWCGFWFEGRKFLDYFAFKVNEEWLSPNNCKIFEHNQISSSHSFSLKDLDVKEFLYLSSRNGSLICILNFKNKAYERVRVDVLLEMGVNIRDYDEDWHDRKYSVKILDKKILITSEKGCLLVGSFPFGNFEHEEKYRDHFPSGEKERVFIPGNYLISFYLGPESSHQVFFIFSAGENEEDCIKNFEDEINNFSSTYLEMERDLEILRRNSIFKCNLSFLERLFEISVLNLEKLWYDSKISGYFAGYPWFQQIWVRDLAWVLPAVVDYGEFEKAKKSLQTIFSFQSEEGKLPNVIFLNRKAIYNSSDSTPLSLIALHHYVLNSGDLEFLNLLEKNVEKALEFYEKNKNENGFIFSKEKESWMDSLGREGYVLELQAFWANALKCCSELFEILGKGGKEIEKESLELERNLEKEFWNEEEKFYFDRISSFKHREKTINAIFPLFFRIAKNWKDVLEKMESEEFTSNFGVRCVSAKESFYNPSGYHTGACWAWLLCILSAVEFMHAREKGFDYLKILFDRIGKNCVLSLEEAWNPENGSSVLMKENKVEESAYLQAWSSLAIRAIDEFMLGIKINAFEGRIFLSPFLKDGMVVERRKRMGNDWVNLAIRRKGRKIEVNLKSELGKEYKIVKAPIKA